MILSLFVACAYLQISSLQKSFISGCHLCGFPNYEGSMGTARHFGWIPQWRCEYQTNFFLFPIYFWACLKYLVSQWLLQYNVLKQFTSKAFKNFLVCKLEIQKQIAGEDLLQFKHSCHIFSVLLFFLNIPLVSILQLINIIV